MEGSTSRKRKAHENLRESRSPKSEKITLESIWLLPEISEQIFKNLDSERLKIYRTVCKAWNKEICHVMKFTTTLEHQGHDLKLLNLLNEGRKLKLPPPIKNLHICLKSYEWQFQISHLRELSCLVTNTKLTLGNCNADPDENTTKYAMELLSVCSTTLTHLETRFWKSAQHCPQVNFQFPRLKVLVLTGSGRLQSLFPVTHSPEEELTFFASIISASPALKRLELKSLLSTVELVKGADLSKIEELHLGHNDICRNPARCSELRAMGIVNLTSLSLNMDWLGMGDDGSELPGVISQFTDTIRQLKLRGPTTNMTITCPKLSQLKTAWFSAEGWDPIHLPALKVLNMYNFFAGEPDTLLSPFASVLDVCFRDLHRSQRVFSNEPLTRSEKELMLGQLVSLFPNATSWTVPYKHLRQFIGIASAADLKVERLRVDVFRFDERTCIDPFFAAVDAVRDADRETFSTLHHLSGLKELELYNDEKTGKDRNFDLADIDFKKLPNLKKLLHFGKGLSELETSLEQLKDLDDVVVVYDSSSDPDMVTGDLKYLTQSSNLRFGLKNISLMRNNDL